VSESRAVSHPADIDIDIRCPGKGETRRCPICSYRVRASELTCAAEAGFRMKELTKVLQSIESGEQRAAEEILSLIYDELRRLAAAKLASQGPGTLQATALVHEVWLNCADLARANWQ